MKTYYTESDEVGNGEVRAGTSLNIVIVLLKARIV
jgi:hypothetical protein